MFTLKLYKRTAPETVITKVLSCHHVETMTFGTEDHKGLELRAYDTAEPSPYTTYLIGEEAVFTPKERPSEYIHTWFGWGLLENAAGRTTEHFRPAGYG